MTNKWYEPQLSSFHTNWLPCVSPHTPLLHLHTSRWSILSCTHTKPWRLDMDDTLTCNLQLTEIHQNLADVYVCISTATCQNMGTFNLSLPIYLYHYTMEVRTINECFITDKIDDNRPHGSASWEQLDTISSGYWDCTGNLLFSSGKDLFTLHSQ